MTLSEVTTVLISIEGDEKSRGQRYVEEKGGDECAYNERVAWEEDPPPPQNGRTIAPHTSPSHNYAKTPPKPIHHFQNIFKQFKPENRLVI